MPKKLLIFYFTLFLEAKNSSAQTPQKKTIRVFAFKKNSLKQKKKKMI